VKQQSIRYVTSGVADSFSHPALIF